MPMKRDRYPADWDEIAKRIKERAGWKCEFCGVPHGATIMRSTVNPVKYLVARDGCWYTPDGDLLRITELPMEFDNSKITKVIMTTHHIGIPKPDGSPGSPHDKMDCREENLVCLCQRCHFIEDLPIHIINARISRRRNKRLRKLRDGQLELKGF